MDPYRSVSRDAEAEAPRDPGIVGEVIAQFADPLAFYRELVQNAIDAGSPTVEVKLEHDPDARIARVVVRDRGEGMTRDVIENQLLVLFRSTKERDDKKIGKFGIGFASVLSPDPEVVIVHSARDGRRLTLHLYRDLTYQLYDAGPATQTGTSVELELAMPAERMAGFAVSSRAALERWCRHATVPIELTVQLPGERARPVRIDRPLGLDGALVEVRGRSADGQLTAVVGLAAGASPYTGLFNHGLMLFETREPLLGPVAAVIQDARLGHTLSRDNVRRDHAFDRAIGFARDLVERELPVAAAAAVRAAAEAGDPAPYRTLVRAILAARMELPKRAWWFPLIRPLPGPPRAPPGDAGDADDAGVAFDAPAGGPDAARSSAASALRGRVWTAAAPSATTAILIARGEPVLADPDGGLAELVRTVAGAEPIDVARELTCITPVARTPEDEALLDVLGALLAAAYRAPAAIVLAEVTGAAADRFVLGGDPERAGEAHVVDRERAAHSPFARLRRPALVLSAGHPWLRAARAADPRLAGSHLARQILLHYRLLEVARSTTILEATLDRIGFQGGEA